MKQYVSIEYRLGVLRRTFVRINRLKKLTSFSLDLVKLHHDVLDKNDNHNHTSLSSFLVSGTYGHRQIKRPI